MNLKGLVHRELGEGLTEQEVASSVGVSERTIANILAGKLPHDRAIWEKFARYFRMDVDFLRTGEAAHTRTTVELPGSTHHSAGHYVVVESADGRPEGALLRQFKEIGGQFILHPLNRRYEDLPMTNRQRILGRVVRLRKNL